MPDNLELFPFDIQVLAFNRPEYLERCLMALKAQTLPIDPKRIYFWQDGYSGSKDEHLQLQDNTSLSLELIKLYFPDSKIYVCLENRGIGLSYKAAEENAFIRHGNEWGVFIEEDNILQNYYLEVILKLINNFQEYDEIVQLDAFGDYRNQIGDDYFIPMHSWAFALRARHYFERKDLLSGYEEILGEHAYFKRDSSRILNYFDQFGITPLGNSQDYIKRILMSHLKKNCCYNSFFWGLQHWSSWRTL